MPTYDPEELENTLRDKVGTKLSIYKKIVGEFDDRYLFLFQFTMSATRVKERVLAMKTRREKSELEEEAEAAAMDKEEKEIRTLLQQQMDGIIK